MKVKVKQDFELHSNHRAYEGDILDLIIVNYDYDIDRIFVILEKCGHIFKVFFNNEFEANKHLEFNYEENKSTDYVWIREDEVNKRIDEVCKEKDEQIEYWKSKVMKLIEKI